MSAHCSLSPDDVFVCCVGSMCVVLCCVVLCCVVLCCVVLCCVVLCWVQLSVLTGCRLHWSMVGR